MTRYPLEALRGRSTAALPSCSLDTQEALAQRASDAHTHCHDRSKVAFDPVTLSPSTSHSLPQGFSQPDDSTAESVPTSTQRIQPLNSPQDKAV